MLCSPPLQPPIYSTEFYKVWIRPCWCYRMAKLFVNGVQWGFLDGVSCTNIVITPLCPSTLFCLSERGKAEWENLFPSILLLSLGSKWLCARITNHITLQHCCFDCLSIKERDHWCTPWLCDSSSLSRNKSDVCCNYCNHLLILDGGFTVYSKFLSSSTQQAWNLS